VVLWSLAMLALDFIDHRFPWRGFALNWIVASAFITGYLFMALGIANLGGGNAAPIVILPQLAVAILAYPITARLVALADRFRLIPIRKV
jgi:rod shape-determining protein MreD